MKLLTTLLLAAFSGIIIAEESAKVAIGEKFTECLSYSLDFFSVDGDFDNAYERYRNGAELSLAPGKVELAAWCREFDRKTDLGCMYKVDTSEPSQRILVTLSAGASYIIKCSPEGAVEIVGS